MQSSLCVYFLSCLPHSGYWGMKALHSQHSVWKMLQADNKMLQSDLQHEPLPGAMHHASTLYLLPDLPFTANQSRHLGQHPDFTDEQPEMENISVPPWGPRVRRGRVRVPLSGSLQGDTSPPPPTPSLLLHDGQGLSFSSWPNFLPLSTLYSIKKPKNSFKKNSWTSTAECLLHGKRHTDRNFASFYSNWSLPPSWYTDAEMYLLMMVWGGVVLAFQI